MKEEAPKAKKAWSAASAPWNKKKSSPQASPVVLSVAQKRRNERGTQTKLKQHSNAINTDAAAAAAAAATVVTTIETVV